MPSKGKLKYFLSYFYPSFASKLDGSNSMPILCYHSINPFPHEECDPMTPELFEDHLIFLKQNYSVIPLSEALEGIINHDNFTKPPAVITFDDGYIDNYEYAFPLLKKHNLHATIFVVTGFINKEIDLIDSPYWGPLSWEHIQAMDSSTNIEIGAHTNSHRILSDLDDIEAYAEIEKSKLVLEEKLNRDINLFAYPNGRGEDISLASVKAVKKLGFKIAVSTFWRTSHKIEQKFIMNRVMIKGDDDLSTLNNKLKGKFDYLYFLHKARSFILSNFFRKGIWR